VAYEVWLGSLLCVFNKEHTTVHACVTYSVYRFGRCNRREQETVFRKRLGQSWGRLKKFLQRTVRNRNGVVIFCFEPRFNLFAVLHPECSCLDGRCHVAGLLTFTIFTVGQFAHLRDIESLRQPFLFTCRLPLNEM